MLPIPQHSQWKYKEVLADIDSNFCLPLWSQKSHFNSLSIFPHKCKQCSPGSPGQQESVLCLEHRTTSSAKWEVCVPGGEDTRTFEKAASDIALLSSALPFFEQIFLGGWSLRSNLISLGVATIPILKLVQSCSFLWSWSRRQKPSELVVEASYLFTQ